MDKNVAASVLARAPCGIRVVRDSYQGMPFRHTVSR
jgi:hypothetical protein